MPLRTPFIIGADDDSKLPTPCPRRFRPPSAAPGREGGEGGGEGGREAGGGEAWRVATRRRGGERGGGARTGAGRRREGRGGGGGERGGGEGGRGWGRGGGEGRGAEAWGGSGAGRRGRLRAGGGKCAGEAGWKGVCLAHERYFCAPVDVVCLDRPSKKQPSLVHFQTSLCRMGNFAFSWGTRPKTTHHR